MSTGLIDVMKRASLDAIDNAQMCDLRYGKVVSTSPLKVQITNLFTIPEALLVVPEYLTNHRVECTYSIPGASLSGKTAVSEDLKNEDDPLAKHTHTVTVSNEDRTVTTMVTVNNALKVGDKVALLRQQGGQSYFILDRI